MGESSQPPAKAGPRVEVASSTFMKEPEAERNKRRIKQKEKTIDLLSAIGSTFKRCENTQNNINEIHVLVYAPELSAGSIPSDPL